MTFVNCSHTLPSLRICEELYLNGEIIKAADCSLKVRDERGILLFAVILAERGYTEVARAIVNEYSGNDGFKDFVEGFINYAEGNYREASIKFHEAEEKGLQIPDLYFYRVLTDIKLCDRDSVVYYINKLEGYKNFHELTEKLGKYAFERMRLCGQ